MIPMKLVEPMTKFICKIMKLSLHFREFILTQELVCIAVSHLFII
jgi:hypothetical protein